ncbi:MAG: glycine cleavage T C-terminal barrel domain-containing protein, partial [Pseudomonadota bacterium]
GLLNYGTDTDDMTNPLEVRLGRFVDLDLDDSVIGIAALRAIKARGVARHQLGIRLSGPAEDENQSVWLPLEKGGAFMGHMTHKAWSYRLKSMIGYALVSVEAQPGDAVEVIKDGARVTGVLCKLPFTI